MNKPLILVYFILTSPNRGYLVLLICFSDRLCFTHGGTRISHQHHPRFRVCVFEVDDSICSIRLWHADGKEEPTIMFEDEAYSAQDIHHPRIAENWRGPRDLQ